MIIHSDEGTIIYIFKRAAVVLRDRKGPLECLIDPDAPLIQEGNFAKFYVEDGSSILIPLDRISVISITTENFEFDDATSRKL